MNTQEIVSKLWNLCNVLRDDGITYHQYVTELTYILFLKMAKETGAEKNLPRIYRWDNLIKNKGVELKNFYKSLLKDLGEGAEFFTINDKVIKKLKEVIFDENIINSLNDFIDKDFNKDGFEKELSNLIKEDDEKKKKEKIERIKKYAKNGFEEETEEDKRIKSRIKEIYFNSSTNIDEPKNLEKIITNINQLDWYSAKHEGLGNLYEGLLEKNANEKKSGAGQYFTPRPLINIMVQLIDPQLNERCNDPACGTFGFMIAADHYIRNKTDNYFDKNVNAEFQRKEAFSGCELVQETHRLSLMNAMLHDIDGDITLGDTLSSKGENMKGYDVILTNPPFGTKKGGERPTRADLSISTGNKQLNFLQHIYRALKNDGKARAAVVLPDNVLFQDGDGQKVREDLMNKCNLHTILRLPTGIFYAQGVKTNVLFFTRGKEDKNNTKEVFFYDMRTNMPNFGVRTPFTEEHFVDFIKAYKTEDKKSIKDERWSCFTREEIKAKNYNLDLGLIADDSLLSHDDLPDPMESTEEAIAKLEQATDLLNQVLRELKHCLK